jgi:excisionase family DNA binding protein
MHLHVDDVEPLFVDRHVAARLLGISLSALAKMIRDGSIPSVKIGYLRRIPMRAIEEIEATAMKGSSKAELQPAHM